MASHDLSAGFGTWRQCIVQSSTYEQKQELTEAQIFLIVRRKFEHSELKWYMESRVTDKRI